MSDRKSSDGGSEGKERDRSRRSDRMSGKSSNTPSSNNRDRSPLNRQRKNDPEKRIYVSNIPYEYRWQDLKDLFRNEVGEVSYVELFVDENEKPRGCGIVEFESSEFAQLAIEKMHRYELKGRKLVIKEGANVERDKQGRAMGFGSRSDNTAPLNRSQWGDQCSSSATNKWSNTYGLSPQFLESLNINGPLISKVFVANLDYKVDEKKLKEVFRLAGRVINIDLLTDKDGKSRGFGTVEFEHPVEAVQAISMLHNQILFDRRINVRMDKSNERPDGLLKLPEGLKGIGMGLGVNGAPLTDVTRNLPTLNLSTVQPSSALSTTAPNALAALAGSLSQQLDSRLLDNALARRQLEMVGGLNSSLINNASAADLAGLGSANSYASGLNINNAVTGSGGGYIGSGNSYSSTAGGVLERVTAVGLRPSDTIVVGNLPPNTTWQMLCEKFRDMGNIKFAEMKGKDVGVIRYSSHREAERAVSLLDRVRFDGHVLDVRLF